MANHQPLTPLGKTDYRNAHTLFYIKDADRLRHLYCIGKSGTGKSTLLQNMAVSDIQKGKGVCVIDAHSDTVTTLLDYVPEERISDVVYFNTTDTEYPIAFNPLYNIAPQHRHIVASNLIATFKRIWADSWGRSLNTSSTSAS